MVSETAKGLRELADFLDANPQIELNGATHHVYVMRRDELAEIARSGSWGKRYTGDYFNLTKQFSGDVSLDVFTDRSEICRKVVVGTRTVPATEAHEVEIVEWVCDEPLLMQEA